MKKIIEATLLGVGILSLGGLILLGMLAFTSTEKSENIFSHKIIQDINPISVIDLTTLSSREAATIFMQNIAEGLVKDEVLASHPVFGPIMNPEKLPYSINIIIDSNGGHVSVGLEIIKNLNQLRGNGILITCYVNKAQSIAFTLLATICDKRIGVGEVTLMQHRIYYPSLGNTASTIRDDIIVSKLESDALEQDAQEWLELTKISEDDHVFTKEEIKKYNLIDSYYESK